MIDVSVSQPKINVTVAGTEIRATVNASAPVVVTGCAQGPAGVSGTAAVNSELLSLEWGTPGTESGNAIEITGTIKKLDGTSSTSSTADIQIVVSDGATDGEPSATATLSAASTPVGTVLAGSGTATLVIRSASGSIKVKVTEASAGHRYLWISGAGHERQWIRAAAGVLELVFA